MEPKDQNHSHCFNLVEEIPYKTNHSNSIFLQNPHDDHDEDFHVYNHDLYQHHHYQQQPSVVMDQEKRQRRMLSNRESAKRSRIRKRNQIEELQKQVEQLMASNHYFSGKVISLLENNRQILQENSQLKETVSTFHQYFMESNIK